MAQQIIGDIEKMMMEQRNQGANTHSKIGNLTINTNTVHEHGPIGTDPVSYSSLITLQPIVYPNIILLSFTP
jgi:hypothetical protein